MGKNSIISFLRPLFIKNIIFLCIIFGFISTVFAGFLSETNPSKSIGFSNEGKDALYTLEGNAEIFLVDKEGKISGFRNGRTIEEIPGVSPTFTIGGGSTNRKQIYMSERKDLTAVIVGKSNESYNLLIAGGNYYLKLEGVETEKGEIDEIISRENRIEINFDDNKTGNYNLSMDHFRYENGSIYYRSVKSTGDIQKYLINWDKVRERKKGAVEINIVKDNENNKIDYGIITEEEKYKVVAEEKLEEISEGIIYLWIAIGLGVIVLGVLYYKNKIGKLYIVIIGTIFIIIIGFSILFCTKEDKSYDCIAAGDVIKEPGKIYDGDGLYEIKDGKVFTREYRGSTLFYDLEETDIDTHTFRVLSRNFSRDKNNIYFYGTKINIEDTCSFEIMPFVDERGFSDGFARDKFNIYHKGKILKNADVNSFQKLGRYFYKDKNHVFNNYAEILYDADVYSFQYDANKYIYYDLKGVHINDKIYIKGADGKTFKNVGGYYYKDKNNVYFRSNKLDDADSETFEKISYDFYKDKNHVYYKGGEILIGADASTFSKSGRIHYDKNGVYPEKNFFIPGAEIQSFKSLGGGYYIDNKHAYYINKYFKGGEYAYDLNIIENINKETFQKLSNLYAKDEKNVYYLGLVVEGVDVDSFSTFKSNTYTKDKNYVYYERKIIENADPDTFKYIGGKLSIDKNHAYSKGVMIEGIEGKKCRTWTECKTNYPSKEDLF